MCWRVTWPCSTGQRKSKRVDDVNARLTALNDDYRARRKPVDKDCMVKREALNANYRARVKPIDAEYEAGRQVLAKKE